MNAAITTCPLMAQLRWAIPKNLPLLANARGYQLDALRLNSPGGSIWQAMAIAVMMGRPSGIERDLRMHDFEAI